MTKVRFLLSCIGLAASVLPVVAEPLAPWDPPFSSERIEHLPPEIRRAVLSKCKRQPQAGHYFATYANHSNVVHLDYSLLECSDRPTTCNALRCLHETFVRRHGRYVLVRADLEPRR